MRSLPITQLIAAIRRVARQVPGATALVAAHCHAHDYTDPGKPKIAWDDEEAKTALVSGLVTDALTLLDHLSGQDLDESAGHAVGLLALIAGQDVEPADGSDGTDGRWRIARRTAPDRIISTVDPEARHIHKSGQQRDDGYKAHLAVEPETGLFTAITLRPGAGAAHHEAAVAPDLLAAERGPLQILADAAYAAAELRATLTDAGHRLLIKPPALSPPWSAGSLWTTSSSTPAPARSPAPPGTLSRSPPPRAATSNAAPPSPGYAPPVRCAIDAPPPRPAAS